MDILAAIDREAGRQIEPLLSTKVREIDLMVDDRMDMPGKESLLGDQAIDKVYFEKDHPWMNMILLKSWKHADAEIGCWNIVRQAEMEP